MRVLYFHQHFSTRKGTAGTRSYELARRLAHRGHEVVVVCGSNLRARSGTDKTAAQKVVSTEIDGFTVLEYCLPYSNHDGLIKRSWTFFRFAWFGIRVALTRDFDLLFATSTPLTAGIPGIFASVFRRKAFIFEVRDLWPELPRAMGVIRSRLILKLMDWLEWSAYRASVACVALSPGIAAGIGKRSREGHPVAMIPNACDLDLFYPERKSDVWSDLAGDMVCVFAGAHGRANGLDAVLNTAKYLSEHNEAGISIVLIGDGREKQRLMQRAEDEGLHNCHFLDLMPKEQLATYLASADVGLQILENIPAFYFGTSPNKFFDYLASGLPVIVNYPGWLEELINQYQCGIAVEPDNPRVFAEALIRLRDNPGLRKQMGAQANRLAHQKFSRDVLGGQFCEFLEQYG